MLAHLDRQAIRKERKEPSERDCRQVDAELGDMIRKCRHELVNELDEHTLIRLRYEQVRGVVFAWQNFLRSQKKEWDTSFSDKEVMPED